MVIISRVAVQFHDKRNNPIYEVKGRDVCTLLRDVPEAIREDPIFDALIREGSLDVGPSYGDVKKLENDPMAGYDATGKKIINNAETAPADSDTGSAASEQAAEPVTKKTRSSGKKADAGKDQEKTPEAAGSEN